MPSPPSSPSSPSADGRPSHSLDLPSLHPLDHSHPLLSPATTAEFDPDAFLLSRLPAPLTDLRDELRAYQARLKGELVELINQDYREFVELGTGLKGEGKRLDKVRRPLAAIRDDVDVVRGELEASEGRLRGLLEQRAGLRDDKTLVQLLLSLTDSLARTETLLEIAPPNAPAAAASTPGGLAGQPSLSLAIGAQSAKADPTAASSSNGVAAREKVVGRVAAEYTRVLYLSDKARKEGCALLGEIDWRIERIRNTLHRDLDHLFSDTLAAVARSPSPPTAHERETLTECLKTYALVEGWRDAEELFKREIVRPLVRKIISADQLETPSEPVPSISAPAHEFTGMLSPIPATPDVETSNEFRLLPSVSLNDAAPAGPQLEDASPLGALYNRLLAAFSKPEVTAVLQVAALLPASAAGRASVEASDDEADDDELAAGGAGRHGFEFFASVVWKEVGERLMDELGGSLFAAGRPAELHRHYTLTHDFFALFESLAPAPRSVLAMRQSQTYRAFQSRWGLGVHFQLLWKEIVLPLEEALAGGVTGSEKLNAKDGLHLAQTRAVLRALETGWDDNVFIPELAYRFWKLSLQIVSRYRGFVSTLVPAVAPPKAVTNDASSADPAQTSEEDRNLRVATLLVREIGAFQERAWSTWTERIQGRVGSGGDVDAEASEGEPKDAYAVAVDHVGALVGPLSRSLVAILARRCAESLRLVRSVASQYRSAGVKREPKGPSYFVPAILKPLRDFFDGERGGLGADVEAQYGESLRRDVVEEVALSYTTVLGAVRESEEKLARLRKGKKTAFSLFGSSASAADEAKDASRIRAQMELDVRAFREEARALAGDVDASEAMRELELAVGQDAASA